ncbi:DUF2207 domain-containing protein [Actinotalea sp. BY-33]|uniref:DUF2207 domain-containing protein n=1 Tax=Actinotalea soli TaxID=2819234 RepID=A0A939LPU4_9CELL|nr:DUF2207 domain-containing protein [Actinotalea soli]MBO1751739.1 DUF2207 domain-containing protein [Actinotalea soli]
MRAARPATTPSSPAPSPHPVRAAARGALALLAGAALALIGAAPAAAGSEDAAQDDRVAAYDLTVDLDEQGLAAVTLGLTMDFGSEPNRGPYLTYPVKQRFDDEQDRVYRITDVQATSETAPTDVDVEENGRWLEIRIGDPDENILTGEHSYQVTFQVEGWVNAADYPWPDGALERDELYLNVVTDWALPVEDVTVTVNAPAEPVDGACGVAEDLPCQDARAADGGASFAHDLVPAGTPLTVAVAYPPGTFAGVEPVLIDRWAFSRAYALTPVTGGLAALVGVGGVLLVLRRVRRQGRDEQFLGLTPGLLPAGDQEHAVGPRRRGPTAVQLTPPAGLHAGQLGTLVDETADPHDVTATIIDLAVRGYLVIEQVDPAEVAAAAEDADADPADEDAEKDWRLIRTEQPATDLLPYETTLLEEIFTDRDQVTLADLRTRFHASMTKVQGELYDEVTDRGWFRGNPQKARTRWALHGLLLSVVGVLVAVGLGIWTSFGLVGLAAVVPGFLMLATTGRAPARTARGTAVLVQAEGFRQYLATAEAAQLRFEEGEDLFSRYLPFAVAFELTERWAQVFADLAAQGRELPEPTWYVGHYGYAGFWAGAATLGSDLSTFTHIADTAISAPTAGSGGSSGFSGGGFSGGGVGGGGGGSW